MQPLRTALIGLGRIALGLEADPYRYKPCTHFGAICAVNCLYRRPPFLLEAVCDLDTKKARQLFSKKGALHNASASIADDLIVESDYRKLFKKASPELLVISTWTESHIEIATAAIEAGVRGIVLEKPVGLGYQECLLLHQLAEAKNTHVWVNFERRYHPAYRKVKHFIKSKPLGELCAIRGRVLSPGNFFPERAAFAWRSQKQFLKKTAREINPLLHDGIHWIDLLLWYVGSPAFLSARVLPKGVTSAYKRLFFQNKSSLFHTMRCDLDYGNFEAYLECGGQRKYFEFAMELDFSAGRILSGNEGHFYFKTRPSQKYKKFIDLAPYKEKVPFQNPWIELYKEVKDILQTGKHRKITQKTSSLASALAGMKLYEMILRAAR